MIFLLFVNDQASIRELHLVLKFLMLNLQSTEGKRIDTRPWLKTSLNKQFLNRKHSFITAAITTTRFSISKFKSWCEIKLKVIGWIFQNFHLRLLNRSLVIPRLVLKLKFRTFKKKLSNSNCKFQWQWDDDNRISDKLA